METDEDLEWTCQYCGVQNSVWVDLTIPNKQDFFEDCRICCRPNRIIILNDIEGNVSIEVKRSDE